MRRALIGLLALALATALRAQEALPPPALVALKGATLLDGAGGAPLRDAVVLISGDRIQAVGAQLPIPPDARVIDLGSVTLLPGLIDCHTHIAYGDPIDYYESLIRKSHVDYAVAAHVYARRTLEAGFTSVREVAAPELVDVALGPPSNQERPCEVKSRSRPVVGQFQS